VDTQTQQIEVLMQASEIIHLLNVSDCISITYHKCADDRHNPENGQFRSFKSVSIADICTTKKGLLQVLVTEEDKTKSFTSEAVVKSLIINDLQVVKNYSLVE
jgi:hypothetical protein